ncbi:MAG: alpha/beta hydrolase [Synergistaceae bacterium]|nr:alpha/beta hydrolase [Synergistaceae bacterium]
MRKLLCAALLAGLLSGRSFAMAPDGDAQDNVRGKMMKNAQIETVQTNGFAMDYIRFGHGERTLAILPGLSVESVTKYAPTIAEAYAPLAEFFTVYMLDRRKELPAAYSVAEMAEDTAAVMRALGLAPISLFGTSQGGMMAMIIAARHPELVDRLILGSTNAYMTPERYQIFEKWSRLAKDGDAVGLYQAFGEAIYPRHFYEQSRETLAAAAKGVTKEELSRFVILTESMKGFDCRDELRNIACPVLAIGSRDDHVWGAEPTGEIAERLKDHAGFELYMYDGYGHAAYDTAPDYKARLLRFLRPEK